MTARSSIIVKISSEAAGEISMAPVVAQEMQVKDLVGVILTVCGKDPERVRDLLRRGSVMQSASRFRWEPLVLDPVELTRLLAEFPDPEPARPINWEQCVQVRFYGARSRIELPRELAAEKRLFRRASFWDALMKVAREGTPEYVEYSYRDQADVYRVALTPAASKQIIDAADLLKYSGLAQQISNRGINALELLAKRSG